MKKIAIGIGVLVVVIAAVLGYRYWQLQNLAAKYKDAKEIASASIVKDRATWTMTIEAVFSDPIDAVWKALRQPERSRELVPDVFRKSELTRSEGNTKTLEFEVRVLSLPSQTMTAELTYDEAAHRMALKTSKGLQDLDVTYQLTALAPDRTLLTYSGTAVERVSIPVPSQSIIEGALRELFVAQVHAIQKQLHPGS